MLILNLTGLGRTYWVPQLKHDSDRDGLWFWSLRWLQVEVVVYSVAMATEFIRRFNRENARGGTR
jgi:hypothetical protein